MADTKNAADSDIKKSRSQKTDNLRVFVPHAGAKGTPEVNPLH